MWAVDKTGEFRFSDDNPAQLRLFDESFSQTWLAEELATCLARRTMSAYQIKEYILTETPCYCSSRLSSLWNSERIAACACPQRTAKQEARNLSHEQLSDIELSFGGPLF